MDGIYRGYIGDKDIGNAEDSGIYSKQTIKWIKETKDSDDPINCLIHRRIQEDLTDLGYDKDKKIWKKNCEIIHTCDVNETVKNYFSSDYTYDTYDDTHNDTYHNNYSGYDDYNPYEDEYDR